MNTEKKISVRLHAILELMKAGSTTEAILDLSNLRNQIGRLGRNNEAIFCGSGLHGHKVIEKAKQENAMIKSAIEKSSHHE